MGAKELVHVPFRLEMTASEKERLQLFFREIEPHTKTGQKRKAEELKATRPDAT